LSFLSRSARVLYCKKNFYIHARLLKNLESVFGPIRNDSALVRIEENIEDIFAEVCEYLYTGDYSVGVSKSVGDAGEDGTDHESWSMTTVSTTSLPQRQGRTLY
jgi:hypothetical protein